MTHRIEKIKTTNDKKLIAVFQSGEEVIYDVEILYPTIPQFRIFESNDCLFHQVKVDTGGYGIYWNDALDLSSEEIWDKGIRTGNYCELNIISKLGHEISRVREEAGITQKELSIITGIHQADISKIERGKANPSLTTLKRIADGMGMQLKITFEKK